MGEVSDSALPVVQFREGSVDRPGPHHDAAWEVVGICGETSGVKMYLKWWGGRNGGWISAHAAAQIWTIGVFWICLNLFGAGQLTANPRGFSEHVFNGNNPTTSGGITTFHVDEGDCSARDYGDGRGESDCFNGNLRSRLAYDNHARLGDSLQYSLEVLVPSDLQYAGGPNRRSLLEIAEWQRIGTIKNHIHTLHLDSRRGVTFDDTVCIPPSAFGSWVRIQVQVRWANDDSGVISVICDGRPVLVRRGNTAIPPDCGARGVFQCDPSLQEPQKPIQFQVGILFRGYGERGRLDGLSRNGRMPPQGGFSIQMRNIDVSRIRFQ